tara:strand:- start:120 stop:917 length:798 start_codon:yes stop_codon:yes gene_type:complete
MKMSQGFWHVTHTAIGHIKVSYGRFKYLQDATDAIAKVEDLENQYRGTSQRIFDNQLAVYSALALTSASGFEDTTYSNDACSSVGITVECGPEQSGSVLDLRLWIDWADEERRECDGPMFAVTLSRDSGDSQEFYIGDDIQKAVDAALHMALPELRRQQSLKTYSVAFKFEREHERGMEHYAVDVQADSERAAISAGMWKVAEEYARDEGAQKWSDCPSSPDDDLLEVLKFRFADVTPHGPFHGQTSSFDYGLTDIEIWTAAEEV